MKKSNFLSIVVMFFTLLTIGCKNKNEEISKSNIPIETENDLYLSDYIYLSNLTVNLKNGCSPKSLELINAYDDYLSVRCFNNGVYNISGHDNRIYKSKLCGDNASFPYQLNDSSRRILSAIGTPFYESSCEDFVKIQDGWIYFSVLNDVLEHPHSIDDYWLIVGDAISLRIILSMENWVVDYGRILHQLKSKVSDQRWMNMKNIAKECSKREGEKYNFLYSNDEEFLGFAQPLGARLEVDDLSQSYQRLFTRMESQ